jgi:serine-threonine kinase receptor-associated protein
MGPAVRQLPLVCPGHNRGIVELQYAPPNDEGVFLLSACIDGTPMLRDGVTGDWIGSFQGHKGAVWGATISDDASIAATAGADFTARIWNAVTGACTAVLPQPHICKSVAFSADNSRLLTAGNHRSIHVYDVAAGEAPPVTSLVPADPTAKTSVKLARFANRGTDLVVSASSNSAEPKVLSVWDVRSGKVERAIPLGATAKSGELSADGSLLSITCDDASVSVFDLAKMHRVRRFAVPDGTESASVRFPAMDQVVTGGLDLLVRRFEVTSPDTDELVEVEANRGHHGTVWVMRWAPDGDTYISGSDDSTIRIWRTTIPNPDVAAGAAAAVLAASVSADV